MCHFLLFKNYLILMQFIFLPFQNVIFAKFVHDRCDRSETIPGMIYLIEQKIDTSRV